MKRTIVQSGKGLYKVMSSNKLVFTLLMMFFANFMFATNPFDSAAGTIRGYAGPVGNLLMAIGAVVGLIGGVRVYIKWNSGDQDVQKAIMGWLGSCIFLILVGGVISSFFG